MLIDNVKKNKNINLKVILFTVSLNQRCSAGYANGDTLTNIQYE